MAHVFVRYCQVHMCFPQRLIKVQLDGIVGLRENFFFHFLFTYGSSGAAMCLNLQLFAQI